MANRIDVEFAADDGTVLRAWLYAPAAAAAGPWPAIALVNGFAGVRSDAVDALARRVSDAGFVVLVHDHRGWGGSDGRPRQDINPPQQLADTQTAISFLEDRPEVDPDRIGAWGWSLGGGHVLMLGAIDSRVRCVVAQVPTISGSEILRRRGGEQLAAFRAAFLRDRRARFHGADPAVIAVAHAEQPAAWQDPDSIATYTRDPAPNWLNQVTLRSLEADGNNEPGYYISRIAPTPLLMIVATDDTTTYTDLQLAAYERALEPKRLVLLPGTHWDLYASEPARQAAVDWFTEHLAHAPEHPVGTNGFARPDNAGLPMTADRSGGN
ncbi:alpha/beta fold hydrolase [Nocardia brasiliensis]|uniref:Alpha/beta fold hydrolase n=1 Tax=Nocardia brasiliensis TaxID=37326 RepID=A0A6G9XJU9_NOCBR|nr:alpha/beta fold hydrolase [Nocardia brasiliensis]QIS01179.1 alpha/beta fold hydrolase [Nocardia brasiliensis]